MLITWVPLACMACIGRAPPARMAAYCKRAAIVLRSLREAVGYRGSLAQDCSSSLHVQRFDLAYIQQRVYLQKEL